MNNSNNKKQTTSGRYYKGETVVSYQDGKLETERGLYGKGCVDESLFSDSLIDTARENLGVKEMFDAPIKRWPEKKSDEGMSYDEHEDDKMSMMTDEEINLMN